jgi:hypothetical protein
VLDEEVAKFVLIQINILLEEEDGVIDAAKLVIEYVGYATPVDV